MDLSETIYIHARALSPSLQREALQFIDALAARNSAPTSMDTEAFIAKFAGSLAGDFPAQIDTQDLPPDIAREAMV